MTDLAIAIGLTALSLAVMYVCCGRGMLRTMRRRRAGATLSATGQAGRGRSPSDPNPEGEHGAR